MRGEHGAHGGRTMVAKVVLLCSLVQVLWDGAYRWRSAGGREERDTGEGYTTECRIIVVRQWNTRQPPIHILAAAGVGGGGVQTVQDQHQAFPPWHLNGYPNPWWQQPTPPLSSHPKKAVWPPCTVIHPPLSPALSPSLSSPCSYYRLGGICIWVIEACGLVLCALCKHPWGIFVQAGGCTSSCLCGEVGWGEIRYRKEHRQTNDFG